jgi:hypothetical protein
MAEQDRQARPDRGRALRVPITNDVQLEIAKRKQELAEFRYRTLVRRGLAWDVRREDPRARK